MSYEAKNNETTAILPLLKHFSDKEVLKTLFAFKVSNDLEILCSGTLFDEKDKVLREQYNETLKNITCGEIVLENKYSKKSSDFSVLLLKAGNKKIFLSNRSSENGEFRGEALRKVLEEAKKNPNKSALSVYDCLTAHIKSDLLCSPDFDVWVRGSCRTLIGEFSKRVSNDVLNYLREYLSNFFDELKVKVIDLLKASENEEEFAKKISQFMQTDPLMKEISLFISIMYQTFPERKENVIVDKVQQENIKNLLEIVLKDHSVAQSGKTRMSYFIEEFNLIQSAKEIFEKSCNPSYRCMVKDFSRILLFINEIKINCSKKEIALKGIYSIYAECIENKVLALHFALNNHQDGLFGGTLFVRGLMMEKVSQMREGVFFTPEQIQLNHYINNVVEEIRIDKVDNQENLFHYTAICKSKGADHQNEILYAESFFIQLDEKQQIITYKNLTFKLGETAKNLGLSETSLNSALVGYENSYSIAEANKLGLADEFNAKYCGKMVNQYHFNLEVKDNDEKIIFIFNEINVIDSKTDRLFKALKKYQECNEWIFDKGSNGRGVVEINKSDLNKFEKIMNEEMDKIDAVFEKAKKKVIDAALLFQNSIIDNIILNACNPHYKQAVADFIRTPLFINDKEIDRIKAAAQKKGIVASYSEVIEDPEMAFHFALNNHQGALFCAAGFIVAYIQNRISADESITEEEREDKGNYINQASHKRLTKINTLGENLYEYSVSAVHPETKEEIYAIKFYIEKDNGNIIYKNPKITLGDTAKKIGLSEANLNLEIAGQEKIHPIAKANKINLAKILKTDHECGEVAGFDLAVEEQDETIKFVFKDVSNRASKAYYLFHALGDDVKIEVYKDELFEIEEIIFKHMITINHLFAESFPEYLNRVLEQKKKGQCDSPFFLRKCTDQHVRVSLIFDGFPLHEKIINLLATDVKIKLENLFDGELGKEKLRKLMDEDPRYPGVEVRDIHIELHKIWVSIFRLLFMELLDPFTGEFKPEVRRALIKYNPNFTGWEKNLGQENLKLNIVDSYFYHVVYANLIANLDVDAHMACVFGKEFAFYSSISKDKLKVNKLMKNYIDCWCEQNKQASAITAIKATKYPVVKSMTFDAEKGPDVMLSLIFPFAENGFSIELIYDLEKPKKSEDTAVAEFFCLAQDDLIIKSMIVQNILSGNPLSLFDQEIIKRVTAPYFDHLNNKEFIFNGFELQKVDRETQILALYIYSGFSENWAETILVRMTDQQDVGQNSLLSAAFQVEIATRQQNGVVVNKILSDALAKDEPARKVAREIIENAPECVIRKLKLQNLDKLDDITQILSENFDKMSGVNNEF